MKKLANKDDTKKALIYLEKKITEIYLLMNPEEKNNNQMDALITKRPLFLNCNNCEKDDQQLFNNKNKNKNILKNYNINAAKTLP